MAAIGKTEIEEMLTGDMGIQEALLGETSIYKRSDTHGSSYFYLYLDTGEEPQNH